MATLDTNVLVRFIFGDDRRQFELARSFIKDTIRSGRLFLPVSVAVELEWVLRSRYGLGKAEIILIFNRLLESEEIDFRMSHQSRLRCISTQRILQILLTAYTLHLHSRISSFQW